MSLFARRESRSVSYQDVWGSGRDWQELVAGYKPATALALSAVRACVRLKASTLAQLPYDSYREANGHSEKVSSQPAFIARPSGVLTRSRWLTQYSVSQDLWGNAYGWIVGWDAAGYPIGAEWLDPSQMRVESDGPGLPRFFRDGVELPQERVWHLAEFVLPGSPVGIAPLEKQGLVDLAQRAQDFGRRWFSDGASPSAILYSDQPITTEQATDAKSAFKRAVGKGREPAVLGSGWKYEQVSVAANESQFLETIRSAQIDICQSFGVPPEKIGIASEGSSVTYANREQQAQQFLVDTMNDRIVYLQEAMTDRLPRPQFVRFNPGALLRSDLKSRYEAHAIGIDARFLTPNEARALEDLKPIEGGDVFPVSPQATQKRSEVFDA